MIRIILKTWTILLTSSKVVPSSSSSGPSVGPVNPRPASVVTAPAPLSPASSLMKNRET